jgi:hypothetical protein
MRNLLPALVLAMGALLACQSQSPEEELVQQARPAGSWLATLRWTGEQWAANSVPESFVRTTLDAAKKDFDQIADAAKKSQARPEVRQPLQGILDEGTAAGAALEKAVEADDRPGVTRQVARLAALQARFNAWQRQGQGGSGK